jgi:hypothetical protein
VASDSASLWIPFLRRLEQLGGVGAVLLALLEFGMPVPQIPEERIHLGLVLYAGLFLLRLSLELYAGSAWRSRLLDLGLALVVLGALAK